MAAAERLRARREAEAAERKKKDAAARELDAGHGASKYLDHMKKAAGRRAAFEADRLGPGPPGRRRVLGISHSESV